jgi:hypothetical protein
MKLAEIIAPFSPGAFLAVLLYVSLKDIGGGQ